MNKSLSLFSIIAIPIIMFSQSLIAAEPTIKQVGECTAVATITDPGSAAQVTTTCPNGQVTIQFPDGKVKIIQPSGQIIEVSP